MTILELYRELPFEHRVAAAAFALATVPEFRAEMARRFVRRVGGFRPGTVQGWSDRHLALQVIRRELEGIDEAELLLRTHYLGCRPQLQERFLELTGVPHEGPRILNSVQPPFAERTAVIAAARPLSEEFALEVLHYLRTLQALIPEGWPGLPEAIEAAHEQRSELVAVAVEGKPAEPASAPTELAGDERPVRLRVPVAGELGVLDDLLVVALINAANRVDGAIRPEEAKRVVAEFVRVNGQRHQSWYVAGLYHALFDDTDNDPRETQSAMAHEWFMAGRVVGLVRRGLVGSVVELHDSHPIARALGATGEGASHEGAPHIFGALWEGGRLEDAVRFVSPNAIAHSSRIAARVFGAARDLLTQRRFQEARGIYELLNEGLNVRMAEGLPVDPEATRTVNRRRAHIRRMAGEFDEAKVLLRPMAEDEEEDPAIRSMLLTDVALMEAGVRELADLKIPESRTDAGAMARRIGSQAAVLERAMELDPDGAAHTRYVVGFQALLEERGELAEQCLGAAVSRFRSQPQVYTRQGLLDQATLYHALAVCYAGGAPGEVVSAARTLLESTTEDLRIPDWMVESVLASVSVADNDLAEELFQGLVEQRGEDFVVTLEDLADTIPAVALGFLGRSRQSGLSAAQRVSAARIALSSLLRHERLDEAEVALGVLVDQGYRGVGREETLAQLKDLASLTKLRPLDELKYLRAELHGAAGEWDTATALLEAVANGLLARGKPWERCEAQAVVERMRGIPEADERVRVLDERLRRAEAELEPPVGERGPERVSLLVVGGDETQARYESEIRERLRQEAPHITIVEFITTGWSSNWGELADRVIARAEACDGIVLHYYIRTMFGRKVRAAVPLWFPVAGHGRDGILRGVLGCAQLVLRQRSLQSPE